MSTFCAESWTNLNVVKKVWRSGDILTEIQLSVDSRRPEKLANRAPKNSAVIVRSTARAAAICDTQQDEQTLEKQRAIQNASAWSKRISASAELSAAQQARRQMNFVFNSLTTENLEQHSRSLVNASRDPEFMREAIRATIERALSEKKFVDVYARLLLGLVGRDAALKKFTRKELQQLIEKTTECARLTSVCQFLGELYLCEGQQLLQFAILTTSLIPSLLKNHFQAERDSKCESETYLLPLLELLTKVHALLRSRQGAAESATVVTEYLTTGTSTSSSALGEEVFEILDHVRHGRQNRDRSYYLITNLLHLVKYRSKLSDAKESGCRAKAEQEEDARSVSTQDEEEEKHSDNEFEDLKNKLLKCLADERKTRDAQKVSREIYDRFGDVQWLVALFQASFDCTGANCERTLAFVKREIDEWPDFSEDSVKYACKDFAKLFCEEVCEYPFLEKQMRSVLRHVRQSRQLLLKIELDAEEFEEDFASIFA